MNDQQLKNMWNSNDEKLDKILSINTNLLQHNMKMKSSSILRNVKPIKIFTIIIGLLWVIAIDTIIVNYFSMEFIFFHASLGIISLINKIAIGTYIYHLILLKEIDTSQNIVETQKKLSELKVSTLNVARILALQFPLYSVLHINATMFEETNLLLWIVQCIVTGALTYLSVWLFVNIKMENSAEKWFRNIFNGNEWDDLYKAGDILNELEEFNEQK